MPGLVIWKTQQVEKLRKDMDRMFDRLCGAFGLEDFPRDMGVISKIQMTETEDELIVRAQLSDIRPEDISIDLTEDSLTLKVEVKQNSRHDQEGIVRTERRFQSSSKSLRLPHPIVVDAVKATYREGTLDVRMPKFKMKRSRTLKIEL